MYTSIRGRGGVHYKTSRVTLTSAEGSMLEAMFSGRRDEMSYAIL